MDSRYQEESSDRGFKGVKQMGSMRSRVEVSNKEVKPLSRQGSSASSSSSHSKPLEKYGQQPGIESPSSFRVSFLSSTEQSPQNQMPAGQVPEGYQPNRIPSSIFSSKPATPTDWSTASNESLFSIHVGNNSFSKDQFFMLYKSGELTKLDEQIIAQGLPPLSELDDMFTGNENVEKGSALAATEMPKNTTLLVGTGEVAGKDQSHSQSKVALDGEVHSPINNATTVDLGAVAGYHSQEKKSTVEVPNSPIHSISTRSDGSNTSAVSFVFPVLTGDAGRQSTATEDPNNKGLQTQSVKEPEKQSKEELPPQTPVTPQNATGRGWFSWFYCCRCS